MTDAQTEARAIARKLQDVIEGHSWRLNIDKATDIIATALAAKDAELAAVKENCETVCNSYADENQRLYDRAERAEAQLAEARKALGLMLREHDILSGNFGDVVDLKHRSPDRWPTAAEAARRALGRKA